MINPCFNGYHNKHKGEKVIFFGSGPSIDLYEEKEGYLKIGCNEVIYKPYIMDYYFLGDPGDKNRGYLSDMKSYQEYKPKKEKFCRLNRRNHSLKGITGIDDCYYYSATHRCNKDSSFSLDIRLDMGYGISISTEVIQFVMYIGISELYLVGHDCNYAGGTFHTPEAKKDQQMDYVRRPLVNLWTKIKEFIEKNEIDLKIYSVNPKELTIFEEKSL